MRNLIVAAHEKQANISSTKYNHGTTDQHNQFAETTINDLYNNSRKGLWGLLIFLVASSIALYFSKHSLVGSLPTSIMDQLGSTPPVILINYVFGASTLSSLIIIAGRIYSNRVPGNTSTHLWFRVFFYLLYFISGALSDYFNMVFISGLVVLGLQHYNVWNYYIRAIEINTEKCNSMDTLDS